jgi:hypothetical protein
VNVAAVVAETEQMPTVQAGLIVVLTRVRHEVERLAQVDPNQDGLRELAQWIDENSPALADAIIQNTPAQVAHEQRARLVQQGEE